MAEWNDGASTDSGRSLGQNDNSGGQDDPAAIRAGINETRERLSDTLSEIGERLNPHVMKEQVTERVKEGIREATIGRVEHMARSAANTVNTTRSTLMDTVRDNPVPAAMVAIGLGWMLINGRRGSDVSGYSRSEYERDSYGATGSYARSNNFAGSYPYDTEYGSDYADVGDESGSSTLGGVRGRASNAAHAVRDRASDVADRTRHAASSVKDTMSTRTSEIAGTVSEKARHAASSVSNRARGVADSVSTRTVQGKRRVEDAFQDNPLAVGAVTLALGMLAGYAAPRTEREVELFGDARARVADRVSDVVDEAKEKAQHVASRVVDETKRAAGQVVDETKRAVRDESGSMSTSNTTASSPSFEV